MGWKNKQANLTYVTLFAAFVFLILNLDVSHANLVSDDTFDSQEETVIDCTGPGCYANASIGGWDIYGFRLGDNGVIVYNDASPPSGTGSGPLLLQAHNGGNVDYRARTAAYYNISTESFENASDLNLTFRAYPDDTDHFFSGFDHTAGYFGIFIDTNGDGHVNSSNNRVHGMWNNQCDGVTNDEFVLFRFDDTNTNAAPGDGSCSDVEEIVGTEASWQTFSRDISQDWVDKYGYEPSSSTGKMEVVFWAYTEVNFELGYRLEVDNVTFTGLEESEGVTPISGFDYYKPVTISHSGSTLTDYQINLTVDTASLISGGKMQSDCADIRFADSGGTEHDYWLEKDCNTASTRLWVEVPSIPNGGTTIYMHYGSDDTTNTSDINDVFPNATFSNKDFSSGSDTTLNTCPSSSGLTSWNHVCRQDFDSGEGPEKRDDASGLSGNDGYAYMSAASFNNRGINQNVSAAGYVPFRFGFHAAFSPSASGSCIPCSSSGTCGQSRINLRLYNSSTTLIGDTMFWAYYYGLTSSEIASECSLNNHQLTGGSTWTRYEFNESQITQGVDKSEIDRIRVETLVYTGSGTQSVQRFDNVNVYLRKFSTAEPSIEVGEETFSGSSIYVTIGGGPFGWSWDTASGATLVKSGTPYDWTWEIYTPDSGRKVPQGNPYFWTWGNE